MARKRLSRGRRRSVGLSGAKNWTGCGCPSGSNKVSTRGRGRGWVCQSRTPKRSRTGRLIKKPFVKATCR